MLAKALDVPANWITAIIKGHRGITGDTPIID
jgi:plasmid maintenance system antidote protein VapI